MKKILSIISFSVLVVNVSNAQTSTIQRPSTGPVAISLTAENIAYTQSFPRIDNAATTGGLNGTSGQLSGLPEGWAFSEEGTSSASQLNGTYRINSGTDSTPDTYSCGINSANADRAFGCITGTSLSNVKIGAYFVNNTGAVITKLRVAYTGEQWRNGGSNIVNKLAFTYSTNATTSLNADTWTAVTQLDFTSKQTSTTALSIDGNADANKTSLSYEVTGLNIAVGASFWVRWENAQVTGATTTGDALAIDDFSITPNPSALPVELTSFNHQKVGSAIKLNWQTSSEKANDYFELLRSADGVNFEKIAKINGNGTTEVVNNYSHTDFNPLAGTSYYQLKQVDFNGDVKIYPVIVLKTAQKEFDFNMVSSVGGNVELRIYSPVKTFAKLQITDVGGKKMLFENIALQSGYNEVSFKVSGLGTGVYVATLSADGKAAKKKFLGKGGY